MFVVSVCLVNLFFTLRHLTVKSIWKRDQHCAFLCLQLIFINTFSLAFDWSLVWLSCSSSPSYRRTQQTVVWIIKTSKKREPLCLIVICRSMSSVRRFRKVLGSLLQSKMQTSSLVCATATYKRIKKNNKQVNEQKNPMKSVQSSLMCVCLWVYFILIESKRATHTPEHVADKIQM